MNQLHPMIGQRLPIAFLLLAGCLMSLLPAMAQESNELTEGTRRSDISLSVEVATQPGSFHSPLDATPDPSGNFIYFIAIGKRGPGVFRVAAAANSPVVEIAAGHPFVAPTGIAISSDGLMLYVADAQAWSEEGLSGQIFVLPTGGGTPQTLPGAAGTRPRNLDVVPENRGDVIYYSGRESRRRQPAIFRLPTNRNNDAHILAQGAPLVEPDGIAVTETGVVYVADRASAGHGRGHVFRLRNRTLRPITLALRVGNPAGIALTSDESTLLVSSHQRDGHDQVLFVDLRTLRTEIFTEVIGRNTDAGGVHRARNNDVYSWADSTVGGQGSVYVIRPRP